MIHCIFFQAIAIFGANNNVRYYFSADISLINYLADSIASLFHKSARTWTEVLLYIFRNQHNAWST